MSSTSPDYQAEEFEADDMPTAEEHRADSEIDPVTTEADSADVAEQHIDVPLDDDREVDGTN